jgi:hypothetical protein
MSVTRFIAHVTFVMTMCTCKALEDGYVARGLQVLLDLEHHPLVRNETDSRSRRNAADESDLMYRLEVRAL